MQHAGGSVRPTRAAFERYLRTGLRPTGAHDAAGTTEFKFNPYHDPRNGQFTFAPGGPRSLRSVIVSDRRAMSGARPGGPANGPGGNSRAFWTPMTLQQVFPLQSAPRGAPIAPSEGLIDIKGPANELTTALTSNMATTIIAQIRQIDPKYVPSDWMPTTFQGQMNYLNGLRLDRAAAFYNIRGDAGPLQVETFRFLQRSVDKAYSKA
jgi:hypothetical protein